MVRVTELRDVVDGGRRGHDGVGSPARLGRLGAEATVPVQRLGGGAEADDGRNVFEPSPARSLLLAPHQQRVDAQPSADHEGADPRRPPQLVGAHRHEVGTGVVERQLEMAGRGARVHVHEHVVSVAELDDLAPRLHRADLVVGDLAVHEGGRCALARRGLERALHGGGVDAPGPVHVHDDDRSEP